jgi:hypothetical protein
LVAFQPVNFAVDEILTAIRRRGYIVSVHRMREYVEMHAILIVSPDDPPRIARCGDGDDGAAQLECAKALEEMIDAPPNENRQTVE